MWLSATAVIPQLTTAWGAEQAGSAASWLTMSVQLGFVVGALLSAVFNLPDILHAPRMFAWSAILGAGVNALFALVAAEHMWWGLILRFLTGAAMAGVYPVGMKILSGWFREGRGTALGVLVGSLTVGKGIPFLLGGASELPWRGVVLASSALAVMAAALVGGGVREGPYTLPSPRVDFHQIRAIVHNRRVRLANLGYFGHMWELYAMWTWVALLLGAAAGGRDQGVSMAAFFAIAAGFVGCYWAGRVSDASADADSSRIARRARVTIWAMAVSGVCCLLVPVTFDRYWLLVAVCLVWGASVVADSAQFSTIVSEVSDRRYIGTALTMQTALGFLLTVVSIRVTGAIATSYGWRVAAATMAIGPALGMVAMWRLMRKPASDE
jgi:MFS family permease